MSGETLISFAELHSANPAEEKDIETTEDVDFYLPENLEEEPDACPAKKKWKGPERTKTLHKNHRKYLGIKSYELRCILDNDTIEFCQEMGLIANNVTCSCGAPMSLKQVKKSSSKECFFWRCRKTTGDKRCNTYMSVRRGTWFENSKLSMNDILWIGYMWLHEYSYVSLLHECDHATGSVVEWLSFCRNACQAIMECKCEPLGGLDKTVEIIECHGKLLADQWVFCALEQFSCKSVLVIVKDKNSKSLVQVFDQYILPDSTVLSNIWSAFQNVSNDDFNYLMYQKSITFYDTVSKTEIEDADTMWKVASRPPAINKWTKYEYGAKFCETMYRKSLRYSDDAYLTFLQDVAKIYTPTVKYQRS